MELYFIPLRFKKTGRVWCDGARESRKITTHLRVGNFNLEQNYMIIEFLRSDAKYFIKMRIKFFINTLQTSKKNEQLLHYLLTFLAGLVIVTVV